MTCPSCQPLADALSELLTEYTSERDCLYESSTDGEGNYTDPDDERAVKEMDEIIDRAKAALGVRPIDDAKKEKLLAIYYAANRLCAEIGANGEIQSRSQVVSDLMNTLYEFDLGVPMREGGDDESS